MYIYIYACACALDNVQAETELPLRKQEYTATIRFQKIEWMSIGVNNK